MWMFLKIGGTPKSSILIGFSIINHPFWGTVPLFLETRMWRTLTLESTKSKFVTSDRCPWRFPAIQGHVVSLRQIFCGIFFYVTAHNWTRKNHQPWKFNMDTPNSHILKGVQFFKQMFSVSLYPRSISRVYIWGEFDNISRGYVIEKNKNTYLVRKQLFRMTTWSEDVSREVNNMWNAQKSNQQSCSQWPQTHQTRSSTTTGRQSENHIKVPNKKCFQKKQNNKNNLPNTKPDSLETDHTQPKNPWNKT